MYVGLHEHVNMQSAAIGDSLIWKVIRISYFVQVQQALFHRFFNTVSGIYSSNTTDIEVVIYTC